MNRSEIFNTLRLSSVGILVFLKGIIIFILLSIAVVLSFFAGSPLVGVWFILLAMLVTAAWFVPFIKRSLLWKAFVYCCFGFILLNVAMSPELIDAWGKLSSARKDSSVINALSTTNQTRTRLISVGTPLFKKEGLLLGHKSITWDRNSPNSLIVRSLGESFEDNGTNYSLMLFPRKDSSDKYMPGIFDSTSKEWWVAAEKLQKLKTTAEAKAQKAADLKAAGWIEIVDTQPDANGFTTIPTPPEAVGKTSAIFQKEIIAERANGDVKKFSRPKKVLTFGGGIKSGGLPDVKFSSPFLPGEKKLVRFE